MWWRPGKPHILPENTHVSPSIVKPVYLRFKLLTRAILVHICYESSRWACGSVQWSSAHTRSIFPHLKQTWQVLHSNVHRCQGALAIFWKMKCIIYPFIPHKMLTLDVLCFQMTEHFFTLLLNLRKKSSSRLFPSGTRTRSGPYQMPLNALAVLNALFSVSISCYARAAAVPSCRVIKSLTPQCLSQP